MGWDRMTLGDGADRLDAGSGSRRTLSRRRATAVDGPGQEFEQPAASDTDLWVISL
jgi:hypothetical protein